MNLAPIVRIALRYAGGALLGPAVGATLAGDPDAVAVGTAVLGLAISAGAEGWYWAAKRWGWAR